MAPLVLALNCLLLAPPSSARFQKRSIWNGGGRRAVVVKSRGLLSWGSYITLFSYSQEKLGFLGLVAGWKQQLIFGFIAFRGISKRYVFLTTF
tara:strand:+ start:1245 stop:1523 length:279 start_codon:yes stop_codon:yes gene_type:complete